MSIKAEILVKLLSYIYQTLLRDLVVQAVNNPDSDWDDELMRILDTIFNYKS